LQALRNQLIIIRGWATTIKNAYGEGYSGAIIWE
jgi:hypothetical protein